MTRKGIILAGGTGTRLYPITATISKQLLPVYNKPMIYYPLSILMLAGIREVLFISTPQHLPSFKQLFGNGSALGMSFEYAIQREPNGLAEAFIIGESFLDGSPSCLVLGDNILYGNTVGGVMKKASVQTEGAVIFGYPVKNPKRFGVVEFDEEWNVLSIEEKPNTPRSKHAVPGVYFYDSQAPTLAKQLKPSNRGELEITTLNQMYLQQKNLNLEVFGRGVAWFDTGTHHALLQAANFVETIEERQGMMIGCIEEIALSNRWINGDMIRQIATRLGTSTYSQYLLQLACEGLRESNGNSTSF
ncbi:glucose-1-phosphate thymidylyltransferase RfbA [Pseudomonadales bacterium]|nr:glucose-1-phosphate thymidylyltransferase RfbA [Pseudomonadales bacterium]